MKTFYIPFENNAGKFLNVKVIKNPETFETVFGVGSDEWVIKNGYDIKILKEIFEIAQNEL